MDLQDLYATRITDDNTRLPISGKSPAHRMVHFPGLSKCLQKETHVATMAQTEHCISSQMLAQATLKASKLCPGLVIVEIESLSYSDRTAKHRKGLIRVALACRRQSCRRAPQIKIGPCTQDASPIGPKALRQDHRHQRSCRYMKRIRTDRLCLLTGYHDLNIMSSVPCCCADAEGVRMPVQSMCQRTLGERYCAAS
jgi:hypothetical protein